MLHLSRDGGARLITHDSLSESLAVMQHQEAQPKPCVRPPASTSVDVGEWHELLEAYRGIGPVGRRALLGIAQRMAMGRKQYSSDFDSHLPLSERRDMLFEAMQEIADLSVYLNVEIQGMLDAKRGK
jgi:hypothetical protein